MAQYNFLVMGWILSSRRFKPSGRRCILGVKHG